MYLKGQSFKSDILDSWKERKGKFVRTFGMNTERNHNMWRATWDSIKENIHTSIGMPGIAYEECDSAGCSLTHVEADTFEENIEKQKPFIKTKIVDYILDEENESVDLIHEVIDDAFFDELQNGGSIKSVSPLIWPTNNGISVNGTKTNKNGVDLPVIDTYHWKYVHHAFLNSDAAYGDDIAQVKTTCDGDNCQIQLLSAQSKDITTGGPDLSPLQEIPLLYKHKGNLHLLSASTCVKNIIKKKKDSGIEINDQELAIAYSECGELLKSKSSFKTCTCDDRHNKMSSEENKELKKENDNLKAKLKSQEEKQEKEKSYSAKKGKYAKLFAGTEDEDREKMVAKLKGMDEDDEHKAAQEVHEEMKSKKAATEDPEKENLKARLQAMEEENAKPMIAQLLKARSDKITKDELKNYEKSLKAKTYSEIKEKYEDQKPLFAESIKESISESNNFEFNGGENSLAGKTFSEISEVSS